MRNEKELIKLIHSTDVPEIVNSKCREAYDMIYKECEQMKENINEAAFEQSSDKTSNSHNDKPEEKKRKYLSGKRIAIAVCAAAAAVCFAVPAISLYIPSIKNNIEYVGNETSSGENEPIKHAAPVDPINKETEERAVYVELQNVYCDESNLAISLAITPNDYELLENTTNFDLSYTLTLDGEAISDEYEYFNMTGFTRASDKNYYGMLRYENLSIQEGEQLNLKINKLQGTNIYMQKIYETYDDGGVGYGSEETVMIDDVFEFDYTLKPDKSHNTVYDVNETQDDIILESIEVTPFMTIVRISGLNDLASLYLYDQNNRLIDSLYSEYENGTTIAKFVPPYTTSDMLAIDVYCPREEKGITESYIFDGVPIKEGFVYTVEPQPVFDELKVVYESPSEINGEEGIDSEEIVDSEENKEADAEMFQAVKAAVKPEPAGTDIPMAESGLNHTMSVKDCQIIDYNEFPYDLEAGCTDSYEKYCGSLKEAKILLITCDITNTKDSSEKLVFNGPCIISKDMYGDIPEAFNVFYYYDYASPKDDHGNAPYIYNFEPNETKTIEFGYLMPEECADTGYWIYAPNSYDFYGGILPSLLEGTGKIYEIK